MKRYPGKQSQQQKREQYLPVPQQQRKQPGPKEQRGVLLLQKKQLGQGRKVGENRSAV
jgi:hypothetical protein